MEQIFTCSLWRASYWSMWDAPEADSAPWDPCSELGSWQNLGRHRERRPRGSRFAVRTCDPMGYLTLEHSVPEELHSVEETCGGAVHEELQPMWMTQSGEVF